LLVPKPTQAEVPDGRLCAGSTRFDIPQHRAPSADFPLQPSGTDGLGRMCKPHWTEYTRELRTASKGAGPAEERKPAAVLALTELAIAAGATVTITPMEPGYRPCTFPTCDFIAKNGTSASAHGRKHGTHPWPNEADYEAPVQGPVERARAVVADTDQLGGKAYLDAIASDEVQAALRVMVGTREGPAVHEAMREKQYAEERGLASETPLGSDIDGDATGLAVA